MRELLSVAVMITPNGDEALALAAMGSESACEPDWKRCAERLRRLGIGSVVITLGSRGCLVATEAGIAFFDAPQVEAFDTVGAGDAFNGALAVALAERESLLEAANWANAAGALAVTRPGAQSALPFRVDIDRLAKETDERAGSPDRLPRG